MHGDQTAEVQQQQQVLGKQHNLKLNSHLLWLQHGRAQLYRDNTPGSIIIRGMLVSTIGTPNTS
jgi:hypothetical protein